ncbi:MAG TPA: hypothetical protein VI300_23605 [Solirubrobacter sp.]
MSPEEWTDHVEADVTAVVGLVVSNIPDRRGNFTCLAVTARGSYISLSQVAN